MDLRSLCIGKKRDKLVSIYIVNTRTAEHDGMVNIADVMEFLLKERNGNDSGNKTKCRKLLDGKKNIN